MKIEKHKETTNPLKLLQNTRVQILAHVLVLERILRSLLCRSHRSIKMLQLGAEAHAHLEGVRHLLGSFVLRCPFALCESLLSINGAGGRFWWF